jgi:hypothetical protein
VTVEKRLAALEAMREAEAILQRARDRAAVRAAGEHLHLVTDDD